MEFLLLEITTYASTIVHAVMSFVLWLAVIVTTAAVLVYNRVTKELMEMLHMSEEEREDRIGRRTIKVEQDRGP